MSENLSKIETIKPILCGAALSFLAAFVTSCGSAPKEPIVDHPNIPTQEVTESKPSIARQEVFIKPPCDKNGRNCDFMKSNTMLYRTYDDGKVTQELGEGTANLRKVIINDLGLDNLKIACGEFAELPRDNTSTPCLSDFSIRQVQSSDKDVDVHEVTFNTKIYRIELDPKPKQ